jgi:hypothetical protein
LFLSFLPLIAFGIVLLYTPLKVSVKENGISIKQMKGEISISYSTINEIRRFDKCENSDCTRKFASGGVFGYLGYFENSKLGNFQMYATDLSKLVLIKTDNVAYVISCKHPDLFIKSIAAMKETN